MRSSLYLIISGSGNPALPRTFVPFGQVVSRTYNNISLMVMVVGEFECVFVPKKKRIIRRVNSVDPSEIARGIDGHLENEFLQKKFF